MFTRLARPLVAVSLLTASVACATSPRVTPDHGDHPTTSVAAAPTSGVGDRSLPAGAAEASARLAASPRHGEWITIVNGPAPSDSMRAWLVYPERNSQSPVVVVVHEIFGLSTWVRSVADQLAAAGYIAIVPDLLHGKQLPGAPDNVPRDAAVAAVSTLDPAAVQRDVGAAARYAMALPAARPKYGVIGFCWGGGVAFAHAATPGSPALGASVVYYGTSPSRDVLARVQAPVLGLYGGDDERVTATVLPADSAMRALGKTYQYSVFPGAGHGFLRDQSGRNGANMTAAREAWPRTLAWFRQYLGA